MTFIKNNIWTILSLMLVFVLSTVGNASAADNIGQATGVMDIATTKTTEVFKAARTVLFVVGGFGLIAVAFGAIAGKLNWKWFGMLATGLAILAAAGAVVDYATTRGGVGGAQGNFGDTLQ